MRTPTIPDDDAARVAVLERLALLDTEPEERFDRITRTAAALLDTPIALLNLVDGHRQWSKSAVGMPPGGEAERSVSFCAHVVGDDAPLHVPDTLRDLRFADNPQVTLDPPALRAYHGVPVRGMSGHVLGSLCVADTAPRTLTATQRQVLHDLAGWVEAEFDRTELSRLSVRELQGRQRLQAVTDAVGDGLLEFDAAGTVLGANPVARDQLGDVAVGEPGGLAAFLARFGRRELLAHLDEVRDGQGPVRLELERPSGGTVEALALTVSRIDATDTFVAAVRDVSERRALERAKDEFTAAVSHELRTPLTSIGGTLSLLLGGVVGELPPEACELLEVARDNTGRLVRLVNDILDVERLTAGQAELHREPVPAAKLLEDAVAGLHGYSERAAVPISIAAATDTVLEVDRDRVVQILTNLLANAVRFSEPGAPVTVEAIDDARGVAFRVEDRGRGIPEAQLEHIFDRFVQVDAADVRERQGTGLGLPIARGLAEQHGGRIEVSSQLGTGSRFTVWLPCRPPEPQPPATASVGGP